ncbi:4-hydroxy-3-methylbut-2-enyl diphosphate reductase [Serpentinicella sp. ANB-PHB4]|uniref:4-hydroxy-3-methylbut-2-enyl diphosphate reductase n=1 Tax=Serpentinicella sp. ANB-PHB4 TaxID=3074076 RepID=UPI00285D9549|nr:4-hydroxy-3-methylbut-2-enyl diphosphate reductase [Serpentinicella sp. ANB-PHB4]MDR5658364.1 4-hydroxy-3-methylbut-2-enyl diphosphate reductase [Serpentinicella sp. ANB-PHB4]
MKVVLAKHSGFCFGVEKAINTAYDKLNNHQNEAPIYTLGPLIHNNLVVNELREKGVEAIDHINDIKEGTVIIRSHGIPKSVYDKAEEKNLNLIDATCPFVKRIQNIVKEYYSKGYTIVIVGNVAHPEVIGINGWCNNQGIVINDIDGLKSVPRVEKMCIVAQTTLPENQYATITNELNTRATIVKKFDTICPATKERQDAARNLAKDVDAIFVIGDFHSSNTQKLVNICKEEKPSSTFHVQHPEDIDVQKLVGIETVGVTAGASAPANQIQLIINKLKSV